MTRAMPRPTRVLRFVLPLSIGLGLVGCASTTPGPTASPTPSIASNPSSAVVETPAASATASASPGGPTSTGGRATPLPSARPSSPACASPAATGLLPSDRLVDLAVSSSTTHDLVSFIFASQPVPGPAGAPRGTLSLVQPPFTHAGSGQPIDLLGQHAVQVRFTGMTLASDTGEATYKGPSVVKPNLPALREAIQYDASEGVVGWYIGWDGPGCVTLSRNGDVVTVMIAHQEAPAG